MTAPDEKDPKPAITAEANAGFQIVIGEPSNANLPTVVGKDAPAAEDGNGGLTYANAHTDERALMDQIMATIDLSNPDTIVDLGAKEMEQLANLSDEILNSIQPGVKMAFAEALRQLVDLVRANSLNEIKKRIEDGTVRRTFHALGSALTGHDHKIEASKRLIEHFMTDITGTRKEIQKMTNNLKDQQVALNQNYGNIKKLGAGMVTAAQGMRIVHAATEEYIRRVNTGENTVLKDLEDTARTSGRQDDTENLQTAQASWNAVRVKGGNLLGSIAVFDKNVATLAFTKQANVQNRMQTADALTNIVAEWKADLALFAEVTIENAAVQLLNVVDQLTAAADKQNKELFDMLVDSVVARSGKTNRSLRSIIDSQAAMAAKLEGVGPQVAAQFKQLEDDEAALKVSSAEFRKRMVNVFSNPNGVLSAPPPNQAGGPG